MRKLIGILMALLLIVSASPVFAQEEVEAGTGPDSPLYGLDRAFERISLALTFDRAKKAEKRLQIASERLAELREMVNKGKPEFVERLTQDHGKQIEESENDITEAKARGKNVTAVSQRVAEATSKHIEVLTALLDKVPEQARAGIQNAIEKSSRGRERALANIQKEVDKPAEAGKPPEVPGTGKPAEAGEAPEVPGTGKPETAGRPQ
jgi:hypothetical protein